MKAPNRIVVAYSGGLDTSVIPLWLKRRYPNAEIITTTADVGQGAELERLDVKSKRLGATAHYSMDLKDSFASDYVYPMLRANAVYEGQYLLGTAIARPCIVQGWVKLAREVGADAVAHGATGKGNDQCRFELGFASLAPELIVIAPWRMADFRAEFPGRKEMIAFCREQEIPIQATADKPYSMDANLFHVSYEAGRLDDPWYDPTEIGNRDMFRLTRDLADTPDEPEGVELEFDRGDCVAVNGEPLSAVGVIERLNGLGGRHGVGRVDMVENRFVGIKSRGVYETPGGTILLYAHRQLESITLDREVMHLRDALIPKYAELIYYGLWFSPEREALQTFIDKTQDQVSGTVRVKLHKGNVIVVGRKSPCSLYTPALASMEDEQCDYAPDDASGFLRIQALRLRQRWNQTQKSKV